LFFRWLTFNAKRVLLALSLVTLSAKTV